MSSSLIFHPGDMVSSVLNGLLCFYKACLKILAKRFNKRMNQIWKIIEKDLTG